MPAITQADPIAAYRAVLDRLNTPERKSAREQAFRVQMAADQATRELNARRFARTRQLAEAAREANVAKVQASVAGWIAEAQGREDGAELLTRRAGWVEQQLRRLSAAAACDVVPHDLRGLTAADLIAAQGDLERAARALTASRGVA